jgi:hypothetical protein
MRTDFLRLRCVLVYYFLFGKMRSYFSATVVTYRCQMTFPFNVENVITRGYKWMKPLVTEKIKFQRNISKNYHGRTVWKSPSSTVEFSHS